MMEVTRKSARSFGTNLVHNEVDKASGGKSYEYIGFPVLSNIITSLKRCINMIKRPPADTFRDQP